MASEYFYGITLKGNNATIEWDPALEDNDYFVENEQKLIIKQALIGSDAVEGETNVVEVESSTTSDSIKIPIAILKLGSINQVGLDLTFPDPPVTFTLVQGSGPVHICGLQLIANDYAEETDYSNIEPMSDAGDDSDDNAHVVTNGKGKHLTKKN